MATLLLEAMLEAGLSGGGAPATAATGGGGAAEEEDEQLPDLLLRQFHCLEATACSEGVVDTMLEVFAALPPPLQSRMAVVLGEMAPVSSVPSAPPPHSQPPPLARPQLRPTCIHASILGASLR